jgi:hypothetical protein
MVSPVATFHDEVVGIGLNVPTNMWLEYFPVILVKVGPTFFKPSSIHMKQKVPKGVMKLVFSSSSFAIQH